MKTRDEVRDETRHAFRFVGYLCLTLGFGGLTMFVAAPAINTLDVPNLYVLVAGVLLALGIAMAFPRSALGHYLVAHVDAALDRWVAPDDPEAGP